MGTPTNKVNKVNSNTVKVNVGMVKPQITYIKRLVSKYLIGNKLQHQNNTPTKPQSILLTSTQSNGVQKVISNGLQNLKNLYPHTTPQQLQYIKNHFNTHTVKYLQTK